MPRRSLLLVSMAVIILSGIGADLGWRTFLLPPYQAGLNGRTGITLTTTAQGSLKGLLASNMEANGASDRVSTQAADAKRPVAAGSTVAMMAPPKVAPVTVNAIAITVNGQDVVAVIDEASAQSVRDKILEDYRSTVLRDATAVEQLRFQETMGWRQKVVQPDGVRTVEEAINILKLGTDKLATYVVRSGDTGWDIARSYNVTPEQLAKANPAVNLEILRIGQVLNVTFKEPYVHTQSVSKRIVKEGIPFSEEVVEDPNLWPWQYEVVRPGAYGSRQLTLREYRENGRAVKTEVLDNQVLVEPRAQISKQGTKQIPAMGTGALVYPVIGTTTSYFGPRWGVWHDGLDIAAPTGTAVLAADSGMIVFCGWSGNYGYLVKIDHGEGRMVTWYGHLSRFAVALGDTVKKGQVIGYVGNTGFSTGPHLHYEVHVDGTTVNPLQYYK